MGKSAENPAPRQADEQDDAILNTYRGTCQRPNGTHTFPRGGFAARIRHFARMNPLSRSLSVVLGAFLLGATPQAGADPLSELSAVSSFKEVNLDKLAAGTV